MYTEAEYVVVLEARIKYAKDNIEKFKASFAKNPYSALDGMDGIYDMIAQYDIDVRIAEAILKHNRKLTDIHKYATEQVMKGAYYCPMSTSQTSNLMARFTTKSWARIVEEIESAF